MAVRKRKLQEQSAAKAADAGTAGKVEDELNVRTSSRGRKHKLTLLSSAGIGAEYLLYGSLLSACAARACDSAYAVLSVLCTCHCWVWILLDLSSLSFLPLLSPPSTATPRPPSSSPLPVPQPSCWRLSSITSSSPCSRTIDTSLISQSWRGRCHFEQRW